MAYGKISTSKIIGGLNSHDKDIIDWAIEETGLSEFGDREVESYLEDKDKRAWIAMVLAQETEIVMLDETYNVLRYVLSTEVLEVLQKQ